MPTRANKPCSPSPLTLLSQKPLNIIRKAFLKLTRIGARRWGASPSIVLYITSRDDLANLFSAIMRSKRCFGFQSLSAT